MKLYPCKKIRKLLMIGIPLAMLSNGSMASTLNSIDFETAFDNETKLLMLGELTPELQASFNEQINSELAGAYVYLDLANNFYQTSLDGFGKWFTVHRAILRGCLLIFW